jgi:hypothetical protein
VKLYHLGRKEKLHELQFFFGSKELPSTAPPLLVCSKILQLNPIQSDNHKLRFNAILESPLRSPGGLVSPGFMTEMI